MGRARLARRVAELKNNTVGVRHASPLRRDAPVVCAFLALTVVMTNPLVLHLWNAVEDKRDALLNTWIIAWVGHALVTDPLHLFDANIFYPYHNTLAFSEALLPQGLFALPFNLAFDNTILGYNLVLLGSFFLAAYAMYLFVLDLTHYRGAALVAGTIFAFNPYNLGNLAQVQLLSFGWMPLALMYLRRTLMLADRRPPTAAHRRIYDFKDSLLFGLFFSLQAVSSIYYAFLASIAVALYIVWFFLTHDRQVSLSGASRFTLYASRLALSAIIIVILVVPVALPYIQVQRELGFQRTLENSEQFSASLKLYAEVSPQNFVYGNWLAPNPPIIAGDYPLDNLFPGIAAVALALIGIFASKQRERWFYFCLLIFAFILSLGPRLFISPTQATGIPLPYRWLYDAIPLSHAFRAPVRFDALVMLALAVLAGMGAQKAAGRVQMAEGSTQKAANGFLPTALRFLPTAFCLLIACEYFALPTANIVPVPVANEIPRYIRWLAQQPPGVVLELPMMAQPDKPLDLTTQYLTTYHWHATPDGYSGFNPSARGDIAYAMRSAPSEQSIRLLQALDVRYLIVHGRVLAPSAELSLVQQFGSDSIYRVAAYAQDNSTLTASIYLPQPAPSGQKYLAYLVVRNRGTSSFVVKPTAVLRVDARWSNGTRQQTTAALPMFTFGASVVPVQLTTPARGGTYHLDMSVAGEATDIWNLSGNVSVIDGEPSHQVVLPAQVALNSLLKSSYAPGDIVNIALVWSPLNKINAYYSASVRVVNAQGTKVVNDDHEPAQQTMLWIPDVPVQDHFALALPRDLAAGEYSVQLLMYQADQGIDALLLDENYTPQDTITLGRFEVK